MMIWVYFGLLGLTQRAVMSKMINELVNALLEEQNDGGDK